MPLRDPEEYNALRLRVLRRDGWRCRWCGVRSGLHVHHIIFRSEQGLDETWNLVTVCHKCHDEIHAYRLSIEVAIGNHVGPDGGADGQLIFTI